MEVLITYLCDKKACSDQCPDFDGLCNHTFNKEHAIHKDSLTDTLFHPVLGSSGEIIAFEERESDNLKQKIIDVRDAIAKSIGISFENEEREDFKNE